MTDPSLWRNLNFRLLFSAAAFSNLGDGVVAVALPWFATLLTRDPLLISLVAAARQLPWLLLSLPAGVLTDRFDRKRIILTCDLLRLGLAIAVVGLALSAAAGTAAVLMLAALAFMLGSAEVLRDNTAQTILPSIVATTELERANGLIWSTEQVGGQFIGPPLAGVLIGFSIALPFGLDAAMLAMAICLVWRIVLPVRTPTAPQAFGPALKEGLVWLWQHPVLRRLALVLGMFNFIGSIFWAILVLYVQDVLGLSAFGYGLLMAALAGGGLAGSLIGPALLRRIGPNRGLLAGAAGFVAASAGLAFSSSVWVATVLLIIEAFCGMLWNITSVSYRQRHIPTALLGRVNAAYRFFGTGPSAAGALAGGAMVSSAMPFGTSTALHLPYIVTTICGTALLIYCAFRLRLEP